MGRVYSGVQIVIKVNDRSGSSSDGGTGAVNGGSGNVGHAVNSRDS